VSNGNGETHSQVQAVHDDLVSDGKTTHGRRTALACKDGECKQATVQRGPQPVSAAQDTIGQADAQAEGNARYVEHAGRRSESPRPRSIFEASPFGRLLGGQGALSQDAAEERQGPWTDPWAWERPWTFGDFSNQEAQEAAEEEFARRQAMEGDTMPGYYGGFGGPARDDFRHTGDFIRGIENRIKGQEGSSSSSSSFSRSYSYSNMNGKEQHHSTVTECKNGKCKTVEESNPSTDVQQQPQQQPRQQQSPNMGEDQGQTSVAEEQQSGDDKVAGLAQQQDQQKMPEDGRDGEVTPVAD